MTLDRNGMTVLTVEECLRRLGRGGTGRIAVSVGALPAIFPVNYAVEGRDIYFRSTPGAKLTAAASHTVVAFEVDHVDALSHTGWSVLVVGLTHQVQAPEELEQLRDLPLTRWVRGGDETLICITGAMISGRELTYEVVGAP